MLTSITPLGERGRHGRWSVTFTVFTVASMLAGAALGVAAGALGALLFGPHVGHGSARFILLAIGVSLGLLVELGVAGLRLPSVRRQVNEDWVHGYRGWVYGAAFGAQLGLGVVTVVVSAAVYLTVLVEILTASPLAGAIVGGVFGLLRGATLLPAARVRAPADLIALGARLQRWMAPTRSVAVGLQLAVLVTAIGLAL